MSGTAMPVPQQQTYTNLQPQDVAFIQNTVPIAARTNGFSASIDVQRQPDGLMTATITYGPGGNAPPARPPATTPAVPDTFGFPRGGRPMLQVDFDQTLRDLGGLDPRLLWALLYQEGSVGPPPTGFITDRRPRILYERHIFSRLTRNQYDHRNPDISGRPYAQGEYGSAPNQYVRLEQAMALNRDAALQSCSWGIGQVLGENARLTGYADVVAMVKGMFASETEQLQAVVAYLKTRGESLRHLAAQDWTRFAVDYNGGARPAYANEIRTKYSLVSAGPLPDLQVRAAQICLTYLHYTLSVDGVAGAHTTVAIQAFQRGHAITPADGRLTSAMLDALLTTALT